MRWTLRPTLLLVLAAIGCNKSSEADTSVQLIDRGPAPALEPASPVLRRLTVAQYQNTVRDLFGPTVVVPTSLEPDVPADDMIAVGSALSGLSARGVEQYEDAAYDLAAQLSDPAIHAVIVPCAPVGTRDDACARTTLEDLGLRAWRRPLDAAELDALVAVAGTAADTLGTFDAGIQFGIAGILQSPSFLYRVELGEPDPENPGSLRYTDWEMAARLSYFLLETTPDDELLAAAAAGELVTDAGLAAQVDRLLADERARAGVRAIFSDILTLGELDGVAKDPFVYNAWGVDLIGSAREETLLGVEDIVFDRDADWRELLIGRRTFVDRRLAALYQVEAPVADGFGAVDLPESAGRKGLLGHASFLVLKSHPTTTSVTRRGQYVRERLLCHQMPDPPAGLNTAIPEPSADAVTMRERVDVHLSVPECAGCHVLMDPIGLALEQYDGIGVFRTTESGAVIDPSGDLDGVPFADAAGLADALYDHPSVSPCLVKHVFQYANGREPADGEDDLMGWHETGFEGDGYRVASLLRDLALSPAFRRLGAVPVTP